MFLWQIASVSLKAGDCQFVKQIRYLTTTFKASSIILNVTGA